MLEKPNPQQIEKFGDKWIVSGEGEGWVFNKTYPTLWRAQLALKVFKKGGKISDYWYEAKKGRKSARKFKELDRPYKPKSSPGRNKKRKPRLRGVVVFKIGCSNCTYVEVPIMHIAPNCPNSPVLGRLIVSQTKVLCEECKLVIPRSYFRSWKCKKCGKVLSQGPDEEILVV